MGAALPQSSKGHRPEKKSTEATRRILQATRDAVYARDGGRCTYRGATGKRCGSRHNLQIDHIVPFANGGSNALSNLRLLCAHHNRLEAERVMGPAATRHAHRDSRSP
jgi:5-methylcytosine-specific restriction endonuclease McrA